MKAAKLFSPANIYFAKALLITTAIVFLLLKSDQRFESPLAVILFLVGGYYLGKITCSVHLKDAGMGITIAVFVVMNLVHSFIDGLSFTGQPLLYWLGAVAGHEAIRQPTLYIVLWAILQQVPMSIFKKVIICFISVTVTWLTGMWLGKESGANFTHFYNAADWIGYSVFLFIGDIAHHLIDQYRLLKFKTHTH